MSGEKTNCKWEYEGHKYDDGYYETECDNAFIFIEGGIEDNEMKYCPYCGYEIIEDKK